MFCLFWRFWFRLLDYGSSCRRLVAGECLLTAVMSCCRRWVDLWTSTKTYFKSKNPPSCALHSSWVSQSLNKNPPQIWRYEFVISNFGPKMKFQKVTLTHTGSGPCRCWRSLWRESAGYSVAKVATEQWGAFLIDWCKRLGLENPELSTRSFLYLFFKTTSCVCMHAPSETFQEVRASVKWLHILCCCCRTLYRQNLRLLIFL